MNQLVGKFPVLIYNKDFTISILFYDISLMFSEKLIFFQSKFTEVLYKSLMTESIIHKYYTFLGPDIENQGSV